MRQPAVTVHRSSRNEAVAAKSAHSFVPGQGYFRHGAAPLANPGPHSAERCSPPSGAAGNSLHALRVPGGHREMTFRWLAAERAWEPSTINLSAKRLAFAASYLSRAGWTYGRPR